MWHKTRLILTGQYRLILSGHMSVCPDVMRMDFPIFLFTSHLHIYLQQVTTPLLISNFTFCTLCYCQQVCQRFNQAGCSILNKAFNKAITEMQHRFQSIKAKMPRRESARRKHPLARECDIIETVHMRLTVLQMTFGRHISRGHCCFFPGEVVLHYITTV